MPLRVATTAAEAEEWALVLASAAIPHAVERAGAGWMVLVPADDAARAGAALEAYDAETRRLPAPLPSPIDAAPAGPAWAVGLAVAGLLLAGFALTGPARSGSRWSEAGAAVAGRILGDEPWRAVTALTLHVDLGHVAGNALAATVLVTAVARALGPGLGLALVLLSGALGNVLSALAHAPGHVAVGASTATFGAIGLLAALRIVGSRAGTMGRRPWTVLAAAVLLLAMLGTSRGADVLAHATGLLAGGALGVATGLAVRRPPGPAGQLALGALAVIAVAASWRLALAPYR